MTRLPSLVIAGLATGLISLSAASAQDAESAAPIDPAAEPPRCVRLVNVNGYTVIDNQHLVLNGGVSRHYLVTLRHSCAGLRFGTQLGTTFDRNERVCRPFVEYVIDADGFRCPVKQVEEVESLEAARELIAARAELEAQDDSSE